MILLLAIPLSILIICSAALIWQSKQIIFDQEMQRIDRAELAAKMELRMTSLLSQVALSQKAIKRLAEVVVDMSKRQNTKINIEGITP